MIKKKENWAILLSKYLQKVENRQFRWGSHDCIMHSANAVKAMTGVNLSKGFKYKTKAKAYKIIAEQFEGNLDVLVSSFLGEPREDVRKAKRGDVVRITFKKLKTYGVVDDTGRFAVMITPKDGLIRIPIRDIEIYWRLN